MQKIAKRNHKNENTGAKALRLYINRILFLVIVIFCIISHIACNRTTKEPITKPNVIRLNNLAVNAIDNLFTKCAFEKRRSKSRRE